MAALSSQSDTGRAPQMMGFFSKWGSIFPGEPSHWSRFVSAGRPRSGVTLHRVIGFRGNAVCLACHLQPPGGPAVASWAPRGPVRSLPAPGEPPPRLHTSGLGCMPNERHMGRPADGPASWRACLPPRVPLTGQITDDQEAQRAGKGTRAAFHTFGRHRWPLFSKGDGRDELPASFSFLVFVTTIFFL